MNATIERVAGTVELSGVWAQRFRSWLCAQFDYSSGMAARFSHEVAALEEAAMADFHSAKMTVAQLEYFDSLIKSKFWARDVAKMAPLRSRLARSIDERHDRAALRLSGPVETRLFAAMLHDEDREDWRDEWAAQGREVPPSPFEID